MSKLSITRKPRKVIAVTPETYEKINKWKWTLHMSFDKFIELMVDNFKISEVKKYGKRKTARRSKPGIQESGDADI